MTVNVTIIIIEFQVIVISQVDLCTTLEKSIGLKSLLMIVYGCLNNFTSEYRMQKLCTWYFFTLNKSYNYQ